MSKHKKNAYQKNQFSDEQIQDEIRDQIREIRSQGLKAMEEARRIDELYLRKKQEKKKRKLLKEKDSSKNLAAYSLPFHSKNSSEEQDDEQGQINQKKNKNDYMNDFNFQGTPSISNLGDHIRPLTLTRNKIVDLLNSRRFEELVKGCFVRYLSDSNSASASSSYIIAQIVGVTQGMKQYAINNIHTNILLRLQETAQSIVTLSLQLISNKHPPGGLQITKWLQTNRNKIPQEKQLKEKLQEHNKLLVQQLSSSEIDSNIWKKARRVAQMEGDVKEDITGLIDFIGDKLHNLEVQKEQAEIGRTSQKIDLNELNQEIVEADQILNKLKIIRDRYILKTRKEKQEKKESVTLRQKTDVRKYEMVSQQKRRDAINEKCKARMIMLATYQGCSKLRNTIIENCKKYEFDLGEDGDMQAEA